MSPEDRVDRVQLLEDCDCSISPTLWHLIYNLTVINLCVGSIRGVTIRYPHDTIRIAILESRYDTYRDTW